jgi:hypothetical protein
MTPMSAPPSRARAAALPALAALAALAAACDPAPPDPTLFHAPIEGDNYVDWYYGPLPNHIPTAGRAEDYDCGRKAIDYRHATAFLIPSFRDMDEGVNVLAAYQGEVLESVDTYEDRHLTYQYALPGNRVRIRHPDGLESLYENLKQGGNTVAVGDRVTTGQVIGQAGSSGDSNWPRVGFIAFDQDGDPIDPWAGECSSPTSLWADQHDYPDRFTVVDLGTTDTTPTLAAIASRPPDVTTFEKGRDFTFWVHVMNRPAGFFVLTLFGPDAPMDSVGFAYDNKHPANTMFGGLIQIAPEDPAGSWAIEYAIGGDVFARLEFDIVEPAADPAAPAGTARNTGPRFRAAGDLRPDGADRH